MKFRLSVVVLCLLFLASCKSTDTGTTNNTATNSTPGNAATPAASTVISKVDPCSLLTSDEIKSVQGEAFKNAMRSDRQDGDFIVAQCYYALPTSVNSVVLNVTTAKEGAGAPAPKKFWEDTFGRDAGEENDREKAKDKDKEKPKKPAAGERREEEEGEAAAKPEKVADLGDEAFWIGSRVGGALYVLKKDLFFRISVGGAGDEKTKLNKSKSLAQNALKRL